MKILITIELFAQKCRYYAVIMPSRRNTDKLCSFVNKPTGMPRRETTILCERMRGVICLSYISHS